MNIKSYQAILNHYYQKSRLSAAYFIAAIILVIIVAFFVTRACSSNLTIMTHSYRLASDPKWYPLQLYDKERNLSAFVNELILTISKREKISVELVTAEKNELQEGFAEDSFDGILTSLNPDAFNRISLEFSDPLILLGPVLVVKSNSPVTSLNDLEGKIVGIRTGSPATLQIQKYPKIVITSYDNVLTALLNLEKGQIDGVLIESFPAYLYIAGIFAGKLKVVTSPMTNFAVRIMVKKKKVESELIQRFNKGLQEVKKDGTYDALIKKWSLYTSM